MLKIKVCFKGIDAKEETEIDLSTIIGNLNSQEVVASKQLSAVSALREMGKDDLVLRFKGKGGSAKILTAVVNIDPDDQQVLHQVVIYFGPRGKGALSLYDVLCAHPAAPTLGDLVPVMIAISDAVFKHL